MTRKPVELKREDDRHEPGNVERALMIASVVVVVLLFAYVTRQALVAPQSPHPTVSVLGVTPLENGDTRVEVVLENHSGVGILTAVVEVLCDDPPPSLTFENIPAGGKNVGSLVCPPDTTNPEASVSAWEPA